MNLLLSGIKYQVSAMSIFTQKEKTQKTGVNGINLIHNYKEKTDWDGNYCSDYCVGCGACDHDPCVFVVSGYEENVKEITYYCNYCDEKRNQMDNGMKKKDDQKRLIDFIIDLKNNYEVDETDIDFLSCNDCKQKIRLSDSHQRFRNYQRIVCIQCGDKNGDKKLRMARCKKSFYCYECKRNLDIQSTPGETIMCEQL